MADHMTGESEQDEGDIVIQDDDSAERDDSIDPRKMSAADLARKGWFPKPIMKVIREKCLDCSGGSRLEIRLCGSGNCALWPYRMGVNPFRNRTLTDEQRAAASVRLTEARKNRAPVIAKVRPEVVVVVEEPILTDIGARIRKSLKGVAGTTIFPIMLDGEQVMVTVKQKEALEIAAAGDTKSWCELHGKTRRSVVGHGWVSVRVAA